MHMPVRIIQSMRAPSPFMKSMPDVIMSAISDPKIPVLIRFELLANQPIHYTTFLSMLVVDLPLMSASAHSAM